MIYNTICEDCGTVFKAKSNRAFFCQKCVKRRISESHKKVEIKTFKIGEADDNEKK